MSDNPNFLAYLHDALLISFVYQLSAGNERSIELQVVFDREAGSGIYAGKKAIIRFNDVMIFSHVVYGYTTNTEQIDSWKEFLSEKMSRKVNDLREKGIACAGMTFNIDFHSGSNLQGICGQVDAQIQDNL